MATGKIGCGACGFTIHVEVQATDRQHAQVKIISNCPAYQKVAEQLQDVDIYEELFKPLAQGKVFQIVTQHSKHPGCPGISGIIKTIEVAANMALPQQASLQIER